MKSKKITKTLNQEENILTNYLMNGGRLTVASMLYIRLISLE